MEDRELFDQSVIVLNNMMSNLLLFARICDDDDKRIPNELIEMRDFIDDILNLQFNSSKEN